MKNGLTKTIYRVGVCISDSLKRQTEIRLSFRGSLNSGRRGKSPYTEIFFRLGQGFGSYPSLLDWNSFRRLGKNIVTGVYLYNPLSKFGIDNFGSFLAHHAATIHDAEEQRGDGSEMEGKRL